MPEVSSVSVVYKKQSGDWSSLQLPGDSSSAEKLQGFLEACSTASFGVGSETVIDKAYRDALKLEPDFFRTNFELVNTAILRNVNIILSVGSSIQAELYKLNVYSTGGHFKAHVDTPHSKEMFGSLVVCLLSSREGNW